MLLISRESRIFFENILKTSLTQIDITLSEIITSLCDFVKTQICTIAISLSLFHTVRLPREAFKYGAIPYLTVYSFWLLAVGLPVTLLQLTVGQLSQQDAVGVWRAVPILRGVGHLKVMTSYLCCIYYIIYVSLSTEFLIWIGKGTFPLKDCTKLRITPAYRQKLETGALGYLYVFSRVLKKHGYENKINASQCFNSTFLAPVTEHPQYLGVAAIILFIFWFLLPIFLFRLRKTLKITLIVLTPITIAMAIVACTFLSKSESLYLVLSSCKDWVPLYQPYMWHSALIQALLCTHTVGGYLISAGGTVYRKADVRWTSTFIIITSLLSGWLWMFMWQSILGDSNKDTSFIAVLVLIYQSSVTENRTKEWPMLAYGIVLVSGIITVLTLLFPVYDKLHRQTGDNWRLFATASSAVGTILTVAVLSRGLEVATILDDLILPIIVAFTIAIEVVGFAFIYGWCYLTVDVEFLTGTKLSCLWAGIWWTTPFILLGITGWWLRSILRTTWGQTETLWPLVGIFGAILFIMIIMAAVAVAKEEQFNLCSKIISSFKPSRLWGPEEPVIRYMWMSQRYSNETKSSESGNISGATFAEAIPKKNMDILQNNKEWIKDDDVYKRNSNIYTNAKYFDGNRKAVKETDSLNTTFTVSNKKSTFEEKFRSPNICIASGELGGFVGCNCNRHFTLNVPVLKGNETTTSL